MLLLILLIAICILFAVLEPKIKGYMGEAEVAGSLSKLPQNQYMVINNIMLRTEKGTTQIDHIVVSLFGIFVIETKNYRGWITGGENAEQWTKNMYGKKYRFRNPLKQNYGHVKALEKILDIPYNKFIPIVAFSDNADIKVQTDKAVIHISQLRRTIQSYTGIQFREDELSAIVRKLISGNITDKESRKAHVQQIHTQVRENQIKASQGICPRCGGRLVERTGKYGKFTGCSNYPKCGYTKNR